MDISARPLGKAGFGPPSDVYAMQIAIVLWPNITPGRKTLYIDDVAIPIDLVIKDHPGAADVQWPSDATSEEDVKRYAPKIEFVDAETGQKVFSEMPVGVPFRVRMTFENGRDESSLPVTIATRKAGSKITLRAEKTQNPKVYLSEITKSEPSDKWDEEPEERSGPRGVLDAFEQ